MSTDDQERTAMAAHLTRNLIANFVGSGWSAFAQLIVVPLYLGFIGVEGFALIGFYGLLLAVSRLLDCGISPTLSRELARYSAIPNTAREARNLARTLETITWFIGIGIGVIIVVAAPLLAHSWFRAGTVPSHELRDALMLMGILAALQWPMAFYYAGLTGLQRQVPLNGLKVGFGAASSFGAIAVLALVSPTVSAFLMWQIAVSSIQLVVVAIAFWQLLPAPEHAPRLRPQLLRGIWRFAAGMSAITLSALLLTQLDKILLSKLLDLRDFGYYILASVVSNALFVIIGPLFGVLLPRFSSLVAVGDEASVRSLYHAGAQLMTVLIVPVAAVLVVFSHELVSVWLGNAEDASRVGPVAAVLVVGTTLNGLMNVPYALQLAHGWTKLGASLSTLLLVVFIPTLLVLAGAFGAMGAATAWIVINGLYVAIAIPLTHRRLLRGEARRWAITDTAVPAVIAIGVVLAGRLLLSPTAGTATMFLGLSALALGAGATATLTTRDLRDRVLAGVGMLFQRVTS